MHYILQRFRFSIPETMDRGAPFNATFRIIISLTLLFCFLTPFLTISLQVLPGHSFTDFHLQSTFSLLILKHDTFFLCQTSFFVVCLLLLLNQLQRHGQLLVILRFFFFLRLIELHNLWLLYVTQSGFGRWILKRQNDYFLDFLGVCFGLFGCLCESLLIKLDLEWEHIIIIGRYACWCLTSSLLRYVQHHFF